jgi:predicted N-formylglutamate amidohydrolase
MAEPLLEADDPEPVIVRRPLAASSLLLLGDHAGRAIPRRLGRLGLDAAELDRHIAWDIGVAGLGERLAQNLDATFIAQAYSRLVIDCNRRPGTPGSIATVSDEVAIPGNIDLTDAQAQARLDEIYAPYQASIGQTLDARAGARTVLISLHSFTPTLQGRSRPWRFGVLHRHDSAFSTTVLDLMRAELGPAIGDNEPYRMDVLDNTVPLHADPRGLDYLELEVRQDLIAEPQGQRAAARFLCPILQRALAATAP